MKLNTLALLTLLVTVPTQPNPTLRLIGSRVVPVALGFGACYFCINKDGSRTCSVVKDEAEKIKAHTTATVQTTQAALEQKIGAQQEDHTLFSTELADIKRLLQHFKLNQEELRNELAELKKLHADQQEALLEKFNVIFRALLALQQQVATQENP